MISSHVLVGGHLEREISKMLIVGCCISILSKQFTLRKSR